MRHHWPTTNFPQNQKPMNSLDARAPNIVEVHWASRKLIKNINFPDIHERLRS